MRVRGIGFIPSSVNFSCLPEGAENNLVKENEDTEEQNIFAELDKEILLLKSISKLPSDKERCIFLFEIIRELGYEVDYKSVARSLGIELRWYMRIKASMKRKVFEITNNY